ncbi:MAG: NAD(P)/FAD-dependent oxidoreductase [Desulfobacterales bacterium]
MTPIDVLVIGAGPSGTVAAALLEKANHSVAIVEKERFPRFVIGESLLPRCMDVLDEAGLLATVQKQGYLKKTGAVFLRGEARRDFDFADQFSPGWPYTYQVPRDHFDRALADAVESRGTPIFWGHRVTDVQFGPAGATTMITDPAGRKKTIASAFVIDASGYGRVLPRLLGLDRPSSLSYRESLFTHVTGDMRPEGEEEGKIWICILGPSAWLWIIPFSNGRTSVGVVGSPEYLQGFTGSPDDQLKAIIHSDPNARGRLARATFVFPAKVIRGYSIGVERLWGDGYVLVGNATEFLDPVFSSGVTLAMESASRATRALVRQFRGDPVDWQHEYADEIAAGVDVFRTYVAAWYDGRLPAIFFSPMSDGDFREQICSVLAGYVWDRDNPFVARHARAVNTLARLCMSRSG